MRPISQWLHMMSSRVVVSPRSGKDNYGKPAYGLGVPYQAHVAKGARLTLAAQQQNIVDAVQIYINGTVPILPTAQVTLSTADVGSTESFDRQPKLLAVERRFDENGPHHVVLYCGWSPRSV